MAPPRAGSHFAAHVERAIQLRAAFPGAGRPPTAAQASRAVAPHVQNAMAVAQARPAAAGQRPLAHHVQQALARSAAVQRAVGPSAHFKPSPAAVQLSRPARAVRNAGRAQQLFDTLKLTIAATGAVGSVNAAWEVADAKDDSESSYSCDAEVRTAAGNYSGSYSGSTGVHAEMAALAQFVSTGSGTFSHITEIRITKPTCPRCAYVLKSLGLGDKVKYPKGTNTANRKGPGWAMPGALGTEAWFMEPMEAEIDAFEGAGYSRAEGFGYVVTALQST